MYLEIIRPDMKLYAGEVDIVTFPGVDGSFQILKNHAPIISTLKQGEVVIAEGKADADYEAANAGIVSGDAKNKKLVSVQINGGVIELSNNKVIVLAS